MKCLYFFLLHSSYLTKNINSDLNIKIFLFNVEFMFINCARIHISGGLDAHTHMLASNSNSLTSKTFNYDI